MVERTARASKAPQPSPTTKPKPVAERIILRLNRNLMNYPMARSARVHAHWQQDGDELLCRLPGDHRIIFFLPTSTPASARRLPTGFDMNVLFRLLAEAQGARLEPTVACLKFGSLGPLLRSLGLTDHSKGRARLEASLLLWSELTLRHEKWYEGRQHHERSFRPPIESIKFIGRRVTLTLSPDWLPLAVADEYFVPVPLPLPRESSVQNLLLMILTSPSRRTDGLGGASLEFKFERGGHSLCRKAGLRCRTARLQKITDAAQTWLKPHGGDIALVPGFTGGVVQRGQVAFLVSPPEIPPLPKRGPKARRGARTEARRPAEVPGTEARRPDTTRSERKEGLGAGAPSSANALQGIASQLQEPRRKIPPNRATLRSRAAKPADETDLEGIPDPHADE